MHYNISVSGTNYRLDIQEPDGSSTRWSCTLNGRAIDVDVVLVAPNVLSLLINGASYEIRHDKGEDVRRIFVSGIAHEAVVRDARSLRNRKRLGAEAEGPLPLKATMPGRVVRLMAKEGESIRAGQGVIVVEAMKMQNEIRSPKDAVVTKLIAREGMNVNAGEVLAMLE